MKTRFHISLILLAAALPVSVYSPAPARAELLLNKTNGGDFSVKVMSWWDIPFRSVIRQKYDFSCGSAAVATLLSYHYGRPTNEQEAFKSMWDKGDQALIKKSGFSMFDMKTYLTATGFETQGYRYSMAQLRRSGRPMIVLLDLNGYKHFVVVKGVSDTHVLTGDPVIGLSQYKIKDFEQRWNNIALAILQKPNIPAGRYNLASDWGPWSKAPLEHGNNALAVSIGDMTTNLPPVYQITDQRLLDVRIGTVR
jgi:uncharacterized protein